MNFALHLLLLLPSAPFGWSSSWAGSSCVTQACSSCSLSFTFSCEFSAPVLGPLLQIPLGAATPEAEQRFNPHWAVMDLLKISQIQEFTEPICSESAGCHWEGIFIPRNPPFARDPSLEVSTATLLPGECWKMGIKTSQAGVCSELQQAWCWVWLGRRRI